MSLWILLKNRTSPFSTFFSPELVVARPKLGGGSRHLGDVDGKIRPFLSNSHELVRNNNLG